MDCSNFGQLSALIGLQHLALQGVSSQGIPGGVPSQLVGLTCLELVLELGCRPAEQLQHISSLTALQRLLITSMDMTSGDMIGIQLLSQLTGLQLVSRNRACIVRDT
jgi:hypothetical protein